MQHTSITWFSFFSSTSPSVRYRAIYFLQELEQIGGVSYDLYLPERNLKSLIRLLLLVLRLLFGRQSQIVVIQRVSSFGVYAFLLKTLVRFRRNRHFFLYDLDDAIYEEMEDDSQIRWFMKHVHLVVTGSEELCTYARRSSNDVHLLTTPVVPTERIQVLSEEKLILGFIGCYWGTHFRNMRELVMPALKALESPVLLEIIGANHDEYREYTRDFFRESAVEVRFTDIADWNDEDMINRAMQHWHLGLAPLQDTVVCRAKSAFKVKQYLNLGIPCLSTPVGENARFVKHGDNGFLFETPNDLLELLLYYDGLTTEERLSLSHRAKQSAAAFQLQVVAKMWLELLPNPIVGFESRPAVMD